MNQSNISNRIYVAERKNIEEVEGYAKKHLQADNITNSHYILQILNNVINNQYEIQ